MQCNILLTHASLSPGSKSKVKSSVQRAIRTQLVQTYPLLAPHIDEIVPKKEQLDAMKMYDYLTTKSTLTGNRMCDSSESGIFG